MPSNERENKRREKQRKKDKKTKTTIYVVLIIILAILLVMKVCEINVKSIKDVISSSSTISENYPYNINLYSNANLRCVNNQLVVFDNNSMQVLSPSNAKTEYNYEFGYTNPVIKNNGQYILTFDQSATRFRVDTTKKNLYEKSVEKSIIAATISKNGTVAYSILDDSSKSKLVILNKNENVKMSLDINDGYITAIALNQSATKCAFVTVNTNESILESVVHIVDVSSSKEVKSFEYSNCNIFDLHYCSNNDFYIIADNLLSIVKGQKRCTEILKSNEYKVSSFTYTSSDELLVNYSKFQNDTTKNISYVNANGKIKNTYTFKEDIKDITTKDNEITVLFNNKVNVYSLTKNKLKSSTSCDNSVRKAVTLASKNYVLNGQGIDVIE